jgi:hypothetical protein
VNNKKPWCIWLSFIALAFLLSDTRFQRLTWEHWKKDFGKAFDMHLIYARHVLFLVLLIALPAFIMSFVSGYIAKLLNIDGLDGWLNLILVYFLGVNASWQHIKWRRKRDLE